MRYALALLGLALVAVCAWLLIPPGSTGEATRGGAAGQGVAPPNPTLAELGSGTRSDAGHPANTAPADAAAEPGAPAQDAPPSPAGSLLSGVVLDAATRAPLPEMRILVRDGDDRFEVLTDPSGHFLLGPLVFSDLLHFWHVAAPGDPRYEAEWSIEPFELRLEDGPPPAPVTLTASRPALVIEAHTHTPSGASLADMNVVLVEGWTDDAGGFHSVAVLGQQPSDENGVALFALHGPTAEQYELSLFAEHFETGLRSPSTFLTPPLLRGPWRLEMRPPGSLRVRALDRSGAPVPRGRVGLTSAGVVEAARTEGARALVDGEALIGSVGAGRYHVTVWDLATGDSRRSTAEVQSGLETYLEVSFADGETELAVRGRVVDAEGRGLAGLSLWVELPPRLQDGLMRTGEDGSFEHYARPSDSVVVGTHDDVNADLFDPERVELPFGSEGLLITRKAVLEEEQVRFEVTDARNGSPIEDGGVSILRGTPREWGGWARGSISQGVAQLEVRPRPDLRYRVEVAGFLFHEAPLPIDRDGPIRIALEPGFEARLLVLDARTGAPVVGARFGDRQGHVAAVSDTTGCVHLRSSTWPEELVVQHADYETKLFLGRGGAESVGDRIVLQPR